MNVIYSFDEDDGPRYYQFTKEGRPVFGRKKTAARQAGGVLEQVERHLRSMLPAERIGAIPHEQRFNRQREQPSA